MRVEEMARMKNNGATYKEQEQAQRYIERIYRGVALWGQWHGTSREPIILMSEDVMAIIAMASNELVCYKYRPSDIIRVCGYDVKLIFGKEELYIGLDI